MEFTSSEMFQIQCLIEEKMDELKREIVLEKDFNFKKELQKCVDEYRKIYNKTTILYPKLMAKEIKQHDLKK